jgi:dTDP-4-dehydrorhamnose 3,5-epimerase
MTFTETPLAGVFLVRLKRITDHRGFFARGWCTDEFRSHGLDPRMIQLNVGFSAMRGTLRGMHYQLAPYAESKFIRCTRGAVYDVILDLRPDSPTRGRWFGAELSADNDSMIFAPTGCAHGYQTLRDESEIYYMTTAPFVAQAARGVRYDDPAFAIRWPLPVTAISEADQGWPSTQSKALTATASALQSPSS